MISIILTGIVSLISAVLTFILQNVIRENNKLKKEKSEEEKITFDALKGGVKCLLRSKLMEYHNIYVEAGHISPTEYENWIQMYESYHNLGGNGMITHMTEDIEGLKIDKTKKR